MASVVRVKDGRRVIKWYLAGKACRLSLGRVSDDECESAKVCIEDILASNGRPPHPATREWLRNLRGRHHKKLSDYGMVEPRDDEEVEWLEHFIERIMRLKASEVGETSIEVYQKPARNMLEFFGKCRLSSITRERVNEFRTWLLTAANRQTKGGLAISTAHKRLKTCREWFSIAVKQSWVESNPFEHLKGLEEGAEGPTSRKVYVHRQIIDQMVSDSPDAEWRLILTLWRYAGLRQLEPWFLTWEMIDWQRNRMRVFAPKQRSKRKRNRVIPIWPEVLPHLQAQFDEAPAGTEYVIHKNRYRIDGTKKEQHASGSSIRSRFEKHLMRSAGVTPWPRLIQNLRASGETDRLNQGEWSDFTIATWWNHDVKVQQRHYLMVPDSEFEKAVPPTLGGVSETIIE